MNTTRVNAGRRLDKALEAQAPVARAVGMQLRGTRQSAAWSVQIEAEAGRKVVALYDEWERRQATAADQEPAEPVNVKRKTGTGKGAGAPAPRVKGRRMREALDEGRSWVFLGISVPAETATLVEGFAETTSRKRNFVAAWCVKQGVDHLTIEVIEKALPGIKASISLVALLALQIGLTLYGHQFKPVAEPKTEKPVKPDKPVKSDGE